MFYKNIKKNLILVIVLVLFIIIISRINLIIANYSNEITNNHIEEVQEVFKKEDVIALIQNHLEKKEIETKNEIKYDFLKRYPDFLDCRKNILQKWSLNTSYTDDKQNLYGEQAADQTFQHRIVRGFLVYFPIEKTKYFQLEFRWLYRSWIEMQKHEPILWRTDLIVFIEDSIDLLKQLNCTFENKRKSESDEPMCTLLHYLANLNTIYIV
jgi:hypothetical protein